MNWEIINIQKQPKCVFCGSTTSQMAKLSVGTSTFYPYYICSNCARFVKDAMNKWEGLKDVNYIEQTGNIFKSDLIDKTEEVKYSNAFCNCGKSGLHESSELCKR